MVRRVRSAPSKLVLLAAFAVLLVAPRVEAAQARLSPRYYRDSVHKFSLKVFRDWNQVPVQANEKSRVAQFVDARDRGGPLPSPSLVVVRVDKRKGAGAPTVTGSHAEAYRRQWTAQNPQTAWDATVGRLRMAKESQPDRTTFKKVRSKDRLDGRMWAFEVPYGQRGGASVSLFASLVVFERDEVEYGIFFTAPAKQRKSFERTFKSLAGSFSYFDKKAKEVEELDVLAGVNVSAARRRQIEKSMIAGWDVLVSRQKNYIVVYNTMNNRNHLLAKEIARRIELIRAQVYEKQFPPAKPIEAVSVVRVCGDKKEYHAYGGPGGSAGYWNSGSEELVFYDSSPSKRVDDNTLAVLYHEAFHQYIYYSAGDVAPHSWFNEGHGDYYAGAKLKGRTFKIDKFEWRRGIIKSAVNKGPRQKIASENGRNEYANDGGYTPLTDLIVFTQPEYYSYPGISYAQGWSLIYFLREIVPKNRRYRKKWGHILETYFKTLKEAASGRPIPIRSRAKDEAGKGWIPPRPVGRRAGQAALHDAVEAAFDGIDMDELEKAWVQAVKEDM